MDQQRRDLQLAVEVFRELEEQHLADSPWEGSPFKWVLSQPSGAKSAIARDFVRSWAWSYGKALKPARLQHQPFLRLDDLLFQVKFSTLWDSGTYRFQQFKEGPQDYALCLGLSPDNVHLWLIPAEKLQVHVIGTSGQHTGVESTETWWFETSPHQPLWWLQDCGGALSSAGQLLQEL